MKRLSWGLAALLLLTVILGCQGKPLPQITDKTTEDTTKSNGKTTEKGTKTTGPAAKGGGNPSVELDAEKGVISGVVRWEGPEDPEVKDFPSKIASTMTVSIAGVKSPVKAAPRLEVGKDSKGVADTVIWVVNPPATPVHVPPEPRLMTQKRGDCEPHVLAVVKGTRIELGTKDDMAQFQAEGAMNFDETVKKGEPKQRILDAPGLTVIKSPTAPWLCAYVRVLDNNYFAVTGDDGSFKLPELPPGTYQVKLWHESWRFTDKKNYVVGKPLEVELKVDLPSGKGAKIQWVLSNKEAETLAK